MHCIMLALAHMQPFHAKPESEVQAEQAQFDLTNLVLDQGKPPCI
jgi:hypothetical protein